jgi:hypothetical protein
MARLRQMLHQYRQFYSDLCRDQLEERIIEAAETGTRPTTRSPR